MIATIGVDELGQAYNVNADTVAGAIARGARRREARVPHRRRRPLRRLPRRVDASSRSIDVAGLEALLARRARPTEGMIPKLASCVDALRNGVRRAHILDGRIPHALLLEFFTREGIGTMVDAMSERRP